MENSSTSIQFHLVQIHSAQSCSIHFVLSSSIQIQVSLILLISFFLLLEEESAPRPASTLSDLLHKCLDVDKTYS